MSLPQVQQKGVLLGKKAQAHNWSSFYITPAVAQIVGPELIYDMIYVFTPRQQISKSVRVPFYAVITEGCLPGLIMDW